MYSTKTHRKYLNARQQGYLTIFVKYLHIKTLKIFEMIKKKKIVITLRKNQHYTNLTLYDCNSLVIS